MMRMKKFHCQTRQACSSHCNLDLTNQKKTNRETVTLSTQVLLLSNCVSGLYILYGDVSQSSGVTAHYQQPSTYQQPPTPPTSAQYPLPPARVSYVPCPSPLPIPHSRLAPLTRSQTLSLMTMKMNIGSSLVWIEAVMIVRCDGLDEARHVKYCNLNLEELKAKHKAICCS